METRKRIKRFKPPQFGAWVIVLVAIVFTLISYAYINAQIKPALRDMAYVRVNSLVSDAMYATVLELLSKGALDEPFIQLTGDSGQVYYTQLNNKALTKFASDCAVMSQQNLTERGNQGIRIPIGTLSGVSLFAGIGPNITMKFQPETNTQSYFSSEFTAAGINQTLHKIMLKLEAQVAVALPGESIIIKSYVDVPIAEQIIVGQVPDTYVGIGGQSSPLKLTP